MLFLKPFLFVVLNLGLGYLLVFTLKALLFYPEKKVYVWKLHIPLTPGLIYYLKDLIIQKLYKLLHDFLNDCENLETDSRISKIEQDIYTKIWDKMMFLDEYRFLPQFVKRNLQNLIAQIVFELTRYFVRTFIPYLIERYNIESYIVLLERKGDISILKGYFNRYFYRFLLYFSLLFFFFTGIFNMLIYIIIR